MKMKSLVVLSALYLLALNSAIASPGPFETEARARDEKRYNIAERGAVGDGKTLNTKAIQAVIEECAQNGGGLLVIPRGIFLSGALFLKPGVNIEMQEGSV